MSASMNNLSTYLNDHRAGARFAMEMLERLRDQGPNESLRRFAGEILPQIEEDYAELSRIADEFEVESSTLKEITAAFSEKASRLKLRIGSTSALGVFESLEALTLGILGKVKLWETLSAIAVGEPALAGRDFASLIARARQQHEAAEAHRVEAAKLALMPTKAE